MTQGIILAAGMGRRMRGQIGDTPKSLLRIAGKPLIEHNIDYMFEAGFDRVIVVVGYRKERFAYLPERYDGRVVLVENPDFASSNTVTSLRCANGYFDRDSYITTADIIARCNPYTRHNGDYCFYLLRAAAQYDKPDWIATLGEGSRIVSVDTRATEGHAYTGISHWTVDGLSYIDALMDSLDWTDEDVLRRYWDELLIDRLDEFDLRAQVIESNDMLYEFDDMSDIELFEREQGGTVAH